MENVKTLPEIMADKIIQIIIDDNYNINDKLPTEFEFAARLGVGRGTVREAMRILTARNVVEVRRGAGTYVSEFMGVPKDPFGFMLQKNKIKTAQDLMEIRCLIEPQMTMLAAQNASPKEVEALEIACKAVEECIHSGKPHGEPDMRFHTLIAKCSQNDVMTQLIPIMNYSIAVFIDMTNNTLKEETIEAHREIVEAIKRRDCTKAHEAMYIHLITVRRRIEQEQGLKL